jgi:two-component system cell cycle response regulator CpdR
VLENEGYQVMTAKDGGECFQAYKSVMDKATETGNPAFDLVILDHRMPKKTGLEVANEILAMCPSQEVLMITTFGGEMDFKGNLQNVKLIRKPVDFDEFISIVGSLVRK